MDRQQEVYYLEGATKPIIFKHQGYAITHINSYSFPLTFVNDSPPQESSSLPRPGTSISPCTGWLIEDCG